ncbi:hypothetical protein [Chryseobacterium sp. R2ACT005]|uniref:hypothetical protein n=1 Tax=Chryseobacterium sp. R2ACT005 TaxID=3416668 RepID=UPI003CE802FC
MIYKFFVKRINDEAEKTNDSFESSYLNLINQYLLLLFFIFLFYSIFIITFFGDMLISLVLTVITFFWLFFLAVKGKTKRF